MRENSLKQIRCAVCDLGNKEGIEVIEDLIPLHNVECSVRTVNPVVKVTLEPQGSELPFEKQNGRCTFKVNEFSCHQMIALHY